MTQKVQNEFVPISFSTQTKREELSNQYSNFKSSGVLLLFDKFIRSSSLEHRKRRKRDFQLN